MATSAPSLALVIPVLDDRELLARCLRSVTAQTVRPDDLIVVDNGSTDGSADVARRFGARVVHEPTRGIPAATAAGFDAATADVLARVDADAVLPPTWVADAKRRFDSARVTVVTGAGRIPAWPEPVSRLAMGAYLGAYSLAAGAALGHRPLWGSAMLVRREVWNRIRDEVCRDDARVHDDLDLSVHLPAGTRVVRDRALTVAVARRTVGDGSRLVRSFGMAVHTVVKHWPDEAPWRRYGRILAARRSARRARVRR